MVSRLSTSEMRRSMTRKKSDGSQQVEEKGSTWEFVWVPRSTSYRFQEILKSVRASCLSLLLALICHHVIVPVPHRVRCEIPVDGRLHMLVLESQNTVHMSTRQMYQGTCTVYWYSVLV